MVAVFWGCKEVLPRWASFCGYTTQQHMAKQLDVRSVKPAKFWVQSQRHLLARGELHPQHTCQLLPLALGCAVTLHVGYHCSCSLAVLLHVVFVRMLLCCAGVGAAAQPGQGLLEGPAGATRGLHSIIISSSSSAGISSYTQPDHWQRNRLRHANRQHVQRRCCCWWLCQPAAAADASFGCCWPQPLPGRACAGIQQGT